MPTNKPTTQNDQNTQEQLLSEEEIKQEAERLEEMSASAHQMIDQLRFVMSDADILAKLKQDIQSIEDEAEGNQDRLEKAAESLDSISELIIGTKDFVEEVSKLREDSTMAKLANGLHRWLVLSKTYLQTQRDYYQEVLEKITEQADYLEESLERSDMMLEYLESSRDKSKKVVNFMQAPGKG